MITVLKSLQEKIKIVKTKRLVSCDHHKYCIRKPIKSSIRLTFLW